MGEEKQKIFEPKTRKLEGQTLKAFNIFAALFAGFYLYTAGFGIFSTESHRAMYLAFTFVLCFMAYPAAKRFKEKVTALDYALIVFGVASMLYWMFAYPNYAMYRIAFPNAWDFWFGVIGIILCLEVTRRVLGNVLLVLGIIFLVQLYFGRYLPGILAHPGFTWERIVEFTYSDMQGIFGVVVDTFASYIFPYIIFGAFLQKSGAGDFFIDIACAATGKWTGGPAKVAVLASAFFGSISGSSVANVVATGTFTIPVMKKVGYKPEDAGGIEAVASTGGQFMPPIMGAGAFILASFTETPYIKIALMSALPAILYFYSVGWKVHFQAIKDKAMGLSEEEIPDLKETFKNGWHFLLPLILIVVFLVRGYSPSMGAFLGCVSTVVLSWRRRETRMYPRDIYEALVIGGKNSMSTSATVGTLGIIMAGIVLGGLGPKFSAMLIQVSRGNLFLAIVLVCIVATIIGMGLITTASYIVLSIVAAPALISLGVDKVIAHLICFWTATFSNITPPVCVSAFAGAAIAEADPMKTGLSALKFGLFLFIIPFTFVYYPQILGQGSALEVIYFTITYLLAIPMFAAALIGQFYTKLNMLQRIWAFAAACALFFPVAGFVTTLIGLVLGAAFFVLQRRQTQSMGVAV